MLASAGLFFGGVYEHFLAGQMNSAESQIGLEVSAIALIAASLPTLYSSLKVGFESGKINPERK